MRYFWAILFTLSLTVGLQAQGKGDLKGPAAKNYKPWKADKSNSKAIRTVQFKKRVKGPAAKQEKPGTAMDAHLVMATIKKRKQLKGPAAKHYKPWKNKK